MKGINGNHPALSAYTKMGVGPVGSAGPVAPTSAATPTSPAQNSAAQVTISSRARDMAAEADSSIDLAKVESLRQSISDGSFRIDPQQVAAQMMQQLG